MYSCNERESLSGDKLKVRRPVKICLIGNNLFHKIFPMKKITYCCLLFLFAAIAGCGPSLPRPVVPFSGTLTYQGQSLNRKLILTFTPVGEGRPSSAVVDADGKFKAEYTLNVSGVQTGKLIVTLGDFGRSDLPGVSDTPSLPPLVQDALKKYAFGGPGFEIEVTKKETNYKLDLP